MKRTNIIVTTEGNRWIYRIIGHHGTVMMGRQRFKEGHDGQAVALIAAMKAIPYSSFYAATFGPSSGDRQLPVDVRSDCREFIEKLKDIESQESGPFQTLKRFAGKFDIRARYQPQNTFGIVRMKRWFSEETLDKGDDQ